MPQLQSVALLDRAATPLSHPFVPRSIDNGVAVVVETSGVPIGENKLTVSMRRAADKFRGRLVLTMPVVVNETINGVVKPVVVRVAIANLEFVFDEKSSTQERTNLIGMLSDALGTGKVLINDTFVKLEGIY